MELISILEKSEKQLHNKYLALMQDRAKIDKDILDSDESIQKIIRDQENLIMQLKSQNTASIHLLKETIIPFILSTKIDEMSIEPSMQLIRQAIETPGKYISKNLGVRIRSGLSSASKFITNS